MQDERKSLTYGLVVLGMVLACGGGFLARRQVDIGLSIQTAGRSVVNDRLLASREGDPGMNESEYFYQLSQLLMNRFVDPIKDDSVLASGAVRGMVASLADPNSQFYKKDQMEAYRRSKEGKLEGIGAELTLAYDQEELKKVQNLEQGVDALLLIPSLTVSAVLPGSAAEKAGLRAGDVVRRLDGRWVLSSEDIRRLRTLQRDVAAGRAKESDLEKAREEFRKKADENMTPIRAKEKLMTGSGKTVSLEWTRGTAIRSATLATGNISVAPLIRQPDGSVQLRFFSGAAEAVKAAGLASGTWTIDLRNSTQGDFGTLKAVLELVAPKGPYGSLSTQKGGQPRPLSVTAGSSAAPKLTLLVDRSTSGAAEAFALAMSSRAGARLKGSAMAGSPAWIEPMILPDGSGYTLTTGVFRPLSGGVK